MSTLSVERTRSNWKHSKEMSYDFVRSRLSPERERERERESERERERESERETERERERESERVLATGERCLGRERHG